MAEQTPGNLGGALGGFVFGRTQQNRGLEKTVDRLQQTVEKFADTLEGVAGTLGDASRRGSAAAQSGGATRQSSTSMGNGGHPPGAHMAGYRRADVTEPRWTGGGGYEGRHTGTPNGGVSPSNILRSGGEHASGGGAISSYAREQYHDRGGRAGAARAVGIGAGAALITYTASHYGNQYAGSSMAEQYSYGGSFQPAYRGMFGNNYTAASDTDAMRSGALVAQRSGFMPTHKSFADIRAQSSMVSLQNPAITREASSAAVTSFQQVGTFNRLQALGIRATDKQGRPDILGLARTIISRVGGKELFTDPRQIEASMSPQGSIGLTVSEMVAEGYIPKEAQASVIASIRTVLMAQVGGMSQRELTRHQKNLDGMDRNSNAFKSSRQAMKDIGIGRGMIAEGRWAAGGARDSEAETVGGFSAMAHKATESLGEFRQALNAILRLPGVGALVGGVSGGLGTVTGPLNKIPIINKLIPDWLGGAAGGDGPSNLSAGAASYGGAMSEGSGAPNMSSSAMSYGGAAARSGGGGRRGSGGSAGSRYGLGAVKPWVAGAANILGRKFGIRTIGGYRASSAVSNSDHPRGLALDFMCGKSAGDGLAAYAVANAKELNITYVIWRQRIWSINNRSWSRMSDRGSITANHYDHVHISFLASPNNPDLGGLSAGGGGLSTGNGAGENNPDNATAFGAGGGGAALGGYSEAATLGLGGAGASAGGAMSTGSTVGGDSGGGAAGGGGGAPTRGGAVNGNGGSPSQNIALGKQMAAARGWTGANWRALNQLWHKESGWRTNADNPTSSAYGIPQAMTSVHNMPKGYMTDPKVQIAWGLNYIAGRYGNPSAAWRHSQQKNWYEIGEWNIRDDKDARVHKGEMIIPSKIADAVRTDLTAPGIRGNRGGGGPRASIVFQPGSVVVHLSGGSQREARDAGTQFATAFIEDRRIRQMMEG